MRLLAVSPALRLLVHLNIVLQLVKRVRMSVISRVFLLISLPLPAFDPGSGNIQSVRHYKVELTCEGRGVH